MDKADEYKRLQDIAGRSLYAEELYLKTLPYCFSIFKRFMRGDSILEMGPAEGHMTDLLVNCGMDLHVVEASEVFCRSIQERHPQATVVTSLFETYEPGRRFDNIILGHVLEHVEEPVDLLARIREWLTPEGRIIAAVPNSRSLHRQAGVAMGMLPFEEALNDLDLHHGHRRVYNPETFRRDFLAAGLDIEAYGGYFLKPISNGQIAKSWTPELLDAYLQLGERYPDIAGEIYIVAGSTKNARD